MQTTTAMRHRADKMWKQRSHLCIKTNAVGLVTRHKDCSDLCLKSQKIIYLLTVFQCHQSCIHCGTYTLRVGEIAPKPHGHFGARSICMISLPITLFPILLLHFFFLHYWLNCNTWGRWLGVGGAPITWPLFRLQWFTFDSHITRSRRHIFLDGNRLRQLI